MTRWRRGGRRCGPGRRVGSKEDVDVRTAAGRVVRVPVAAGTHRADRRLLAAGGGRGLQRALEVGAVATIEVIAAAGLRGRGGAGFPTGRKWPSVRDGGAGQRFVVANGAEGEPATFKDRTLMRRDPYRIVEGAAIAAFAVGAGTVYLATKRSYAPRGRGAAPRRRRAQRAGPAAGAQRQHRRRSRRLPLRRGEGAARGHRGPRPAAAPAAAVRARPVRHRLADRLGGRIAARGGGVRVEPDRRQQRRDARHRGAHHGQGRRVVPDRWAPPRLRAR